MYKGIIFDFNGTLFEDTDLQYEAWDAVVREHFGRGLPFEEFISNVHGLGNPDIADYFQKLYPDKNVTVAITDEKEETYRVFCREHPDRLQFLPGVETLFNQLTAAKIPFAIATASEITNVRFYFEMFRLERWFTDDRVVYDDRTLAVKPAPDLYLRAASRLGLSTADCVVCEDSTNGLLAAKNAHAGRIIARAYKPDRIAELSADPEIDAVITDFTGFYPKYMED